MSDEIDPLPNSRPNNTIGEEDGEEIQQERTLPHRFLLGLCRAIWNSLELLNCLASLTLLIGGPIFLLWRRFVHPCKQESSFLSVWHWALVWCLSVSCSATPKRGF
jgi:hypothetical protein